MLHTIYAIALGTIKQAMLSLIEVNRGLMLIPLMLLALKAFGPIGIVITIAQAFIVNGFYVWISIRQVKNLSKGE